jgi:ubiquinone/menaquinone biosynthesis C-methylase UbiE
MESSRTKFEKHESAILDQFTRQAEPFVRRHAHHNAGLLNAMVSCAAVTPQDTVLDVACGPGIVSCFFARHARHVTGLDIVPAMIDRAKRFADEDKVDNLSWRLGSCADLPFEGGGFDRVVTRFSFHHFLEPQKALDQMKRVAQPGGVVLVCDVAPRPEVQEQFNDWEILRDPSHTRALTEAEFDHLGRQAGLEPFRKNLYPLEMDLENLLSSSFPEPGNADRIRALFDQEIRSGTDRLGVSARRAEDRVLITYPVLVLAWRNPNE